ncbi:thioredoxin domain-containing protein [Bradyrhizobium sp. ISRA443]|uniref:thioredoxin domain-containing protein n=1 Tax=unclassified Bradyrhizobium TaxID=2631580 RepID=UPI002479BA1B|nr:MULTISPECIES: thioredoxin domain-containing protein [unclassified Bradyrhizobium]WGR98517.1 thioredoxin domain-containing protein [Bradyrhizobium sp. ISRA436]WGS05406.1 thioredoxin domain-containing protein [Bradyrhizobium sp. ISRA437]WGS12292.1 thioredoxin domain-containing protein [Bradyrhizobium sp. ISRA443]
MTRFAVGMVKRLLMRNCIRLAIVAGMAWPHVNAALAEDAAGSGQNPSAAPHEHTNKLIDSNDPYLLLHAHNPVDWYPWGPEAFAKAKRENKPIFLSIGYSTCFWCHVAERTIYSNPEIAKLMNQWFINVKVDSEERPDVDRIYMLAREIMTGGGGWPNNLFLTPDLKPFYAGSYFPPKDDPRAGPGFPTILAALNQAWSSDRAKLLGVGENVMTALHRLQSAMSGHGTAPVDPAAWLAKARDKLLSQFDPLQGGLADRSGTKFPNAPRLALLLTDYQLNRTPNALSSVLTTLDAIAFGGIHDQLAGGFHRYSTEPSWSVPHFEKMLYDNAQLLQLYSTAFQLTKKPLYREIALETARYLAKDMMAPEGGFYTARDAQLDGVEGAGHLWTHGEIVSILGAKEAERFLSIYGLTPLPRSDVPDIAHPQSVNGEPPAILRLRVPIDQALKDVGFNDTAGMLAAFASDRAALMAVREKRPQPARDEKVVVALNGLTIAALAESGRILDQPEFVGWAKAAADRLWSLAFNQRTGTLQHEVFRGQAQTDGFLQDYASLGSAFMALLDVTGEKIWQKRAAELADQMLGRFGRSDGSFLTTHTENGVLIAIGDEGDLEMPSGTSMAIDLLLRLYKASSEARHLTAATNAVRQLSGEFQDRPEAWASAITTLNRFPLPSSRESAAVANATTGINPPGDLRELASADHVQVAASVKSVPDGDAIVVTVRVDDNFHINANPASYDFLIPTALEFKGVKPANVEYPKSVRFTSRFAPEGLDVYEGSTAIVATFPKGSLQGIDAIQGAVTAQACTKLICLPPSTLPISIAVKEK